MTYAARVTVAEPEERDPRDAPRNWKLVFAIFAGLSVVFSLLVRGFLLRDTVGAIGIGITLAYAIVLWLMWSGRAPRERRPPAPVVMTKEAWIYFRVAGKTGFLSVVNAQEEPLRVPGLADGVAAGVELEVLHGDRQVRRHSLSPRTPPPAPVLELPPTRYDYVSARFHPERSPSGRTVRLDLASALADLPPGRYDVRVRWDATALAGPGLWVPPTPVVLGLFPVTLR